MELEIWFLVIFFSFLTVLGILRYREYRFLKKSTKDAMRPGLRKELEEEAEDQKRKQDKFQNILKKHGF